MVGCAGLIERRHDIGLSHGHGRDHSYINGIA